MKDKEGKGNRDGDKVEAVRELVETGSQIFCRRGSRPWGFAGKSGPVQ